MAIRSSRASPAIKIAATNLCNVMTVLKTTLMNLYSVERTSVRYQPSRRRIT